MTSFPFISNYETFSISSLLDSYSLESSEKKEEIIEPLASSEKGNAPSPVSGEMTPSLDAAYLESKISKELENLKDFHGFLVLKTSSIHKEAIKNTFLQGLLKGAFCPTQFTKYLINLRAIHLCLEDLQKKLPPSNIALSFIFNELWKSEALEEDILFWKIHAHGFSLEKDYVANATKAYIEHLTTLCESEPELIIAHLWVFYGTLLSGGQMIGRSIKKEYLEILSEKGQIPVKENEGVSFFDFSFDVSAFKKGPWYGGLNSVYESVSEDTKIIFPNVVAAESSTAFRAVLDFINEIESGEC